PWNKRSGEEEIDLKKVESALDDRHYGLDEAKERILEYLAVRKLRGGDPHGPILCFVGPPGTGKTSLGEAIGKAIGREFYRIPWAACATKRRSAGIGARTSGRCRGSSSRRCA